MDRDIVVAVMGGNGKYKPMYFVDFAAGTSGGRFIQLFNK